MDFSVFFYSGSRHRISSAVHLRTLGRWLGARTDRPVLVRLNTKTKRRAEEHDTPLRRRRGGREGGFCFLGLYGTGTGNQGHLRRTAHWQWVKHRGGLVETEQTRSVLRSPEKIQKLLFRYFDHAVRGCSHFMVPCVPRFPPVSPILP